MKTFMLRSKFSFEAYTKKFKKNLKKPQKDKVKLKHLDISKWQYLIIY